MTRLLKFLSGLSILLGVVAPSLPAPFVSMKGYQLTPPPGWVATNPQGAIDSLYAKPVSSQPPPSVSVGVLRIPDDIAADPVKNIHDAVLTQEKALPSFTLISDGPSTVAGSPGYSFLATFRGAADGPLLKVHQLFGVNGKVGYVLTGTALAADYDSVSDDIEKSLASFAYTTVKDGPFVGPEGYSLMPPKDWNLKADKDTNGAYFVEEGTGDFATTISVKTQVLNQDVTADQLYGGRQQLIDGLTNGMTDVKVVNQEMTALAGENGVIIEVSFQAPNIKDRIWVRQIYVPHAQRLFVVTMMSKEADRTASLQILAPVLGSFKWVTPTLPAASSATPIVTPSEPSAPTAPAK